MSSSSINCSASCLHSLILPLTAALQAMDGIPHHLIDVLDPKEEFNVVCFQQLAKKAMEGIYARGRIPVVQGRDFLMIVSTYYPLEFLFQFIFAHGDDGRPAMRAVIGIVQCERLRLEAMAAVQGNEALYERLRQIDPESSTLNSSLGSNTSIR